MTTRAGARATTRTNARALTRTTAAEAAAVLEHDCRHACDEAAKGARGAEAPQKNL